jgi:hypothetical protein
MDIQVLHGRLRGLAVEILPVSPVCLEIYPSMFLGWTWSCLRPSEPMNHVVQLLYVMNNILRMSKYIPPNVIDEVRNKYPELFVESTACLAAFCRYLWRLTRWFRYKSGYGWISWRWCGEPCVWRVVIRVVLPVRLYNVQFPRPCMYFPSLIDYSTPIKIFVLFGSFLQCSLKRCGFAEDVPCFLLPPHRLVCSWSSCCSSVWDVVWWSWEISKDVV